MGSTYGLNYYDSNLIETTLNVPDSIEVSNPFLSSFCINN